jgi:hypothetical protein
VTWNTGGSKSFSGHDSFAFSTPGRVIPNRLGLPGADGELGDGATASRFLSDTIEARIRRGERSRLALSNRAISAYQRFRMDGSGASKVRTFA